VVVLLVDRIILGISLRKAVAMPALYDLLLAPFVWVTKYLQPDYNLDFIPTIPQRLIVALDAFGFYLPKLLYPFHLGVDYGRSPRYVLGQVQVGWIALSVILFGVGLAVVVKALLRPRAVTVEGSGLSLVSCGWAIFFLSIMPVLGLIPFGFQDISTVADHYLYLPIFGVGMMAAGALTHFHAFANVHRLAVVLLVVLAIQSFQQARLWRSTEILFTQTMKLNPRSYLAPYCLAEEHLRAGRLVESQEWFAKSLALNPDNLNALISLGMVWANQGDNARAIDHYLSALKKNPSTVGTRARLVSSLHNNLGLMLVREGRVPEAVEHFRKAVALFPRSLNGHLNLGNIAFNEDRYADAIAEYEIAQSLNPENRMVQERLGNARRAYAATRH